MKILLQMRVGTLAGLGCGALLTALELVLLSLEGRPPEPGLAAVLAGIIVSGAVLGGAVAALSWAALLQAGELAARWRGGAPARYTAMLAAAAALAPLWWFVTHLAAGPRASQVLGPLPVRLLRTAAAAAVVLVGVRAALGMGQRLLRSRSRAAALALGLALLVLAVALSLADALLYRRLYGQIHLALLLVYFASGLLCCCCLWIAAAGRRRGRTPPRMLLPGALLVAALMAMYASRSSIIRHQQVRFVALEQTTVTHKLLGLVLLPRLAESPLFLETRLPRREPERGLLQVPDANVVLVTVDALRPDHLGSYGYHRPTSPNIDALASRSLRFQWAYCQTPLTCYSVPSLHTGDYLKSTLPLLSRPPPTLATVLRARGYHSAAFYNASIFFCNDRRATGYGERRFGFDHAETQLLPAPQLTDRALAYLKAHRRRAGKQKLFLWVDFFDVHEPYLRHPEFAYGDRDVDRYDAEISHVDREVGRLMASLSLLRGPTIFVLTADHGEEFREHGGSYHGSSLYEEQIRVPLIIGAPGLSPGVIRSPAQLVDVAPTVLSLLGLRIPRSMRGRSLVPALVGRRGPSPAAFSEVHTKKMVRHRDWKLIHDYRRSTHELYDLRADPGERANLMAQRPAVAARLKGLLRGWFERLRAMDGDAEQDRPRAIDMGRIGDLRAVPLLSRLVTDGGARSRWRQEAALLLGQLRDRAASSALWRAVADDDSLVAAEAATALGELQDPRAREVLPHVVASTSGRLRMRAAIALGRVDSAAATPALVETLHSHNWELQNRAAHYLGFVGTRRAIGPLLGLASRQHLRSRICLALGRLGQRHADRRILPFLLGMARNDRQRDVQQRALAGLGYLGHPGAVEPLVRMLHRGSELEWLPETLSRLGAVGGVVPGIDLTPARRGLGSGWGDCVRGRSVSAERYLGQTWCATRAASAQLRLGLSRRLRRPLLLLRLRPLRKQLVGRRLRLWLNGRPGPQVELKPDWQVLRLAAPVRSLRRGLHRVSLRLDRRDLSALTRGSPGLLGVDYLLALPAANEMKRRRGPR